MAYQLGEKPVGTFTEAIVFGCSPRHPQKHNRASQGEDGNTPVQIRGNINDLSFGIMLPQSPGDVICNDPNGQMGTLEDEDIPERLSQPMAKTVSPTKRFG